MINYSQVLYYKKAEKYFFPILKHQFWVLGSKLKKNQPSMVTGFF